MLESRDVLCSSGCVWLSAPSSVPVGDGSYLFPIRIPSNHLSSCHSGGRARPSDGETHRPSLRVLMAPPWPPPPLFSPSIHFAEEIGLSRPFPSSRCAQDIEFRFIYDHTEISKIQNSSLCYYSLRRFVATTDEDPPDQIAEAVGATRRLRVGKFFGTSLRDVDSYVSLFTSFYRRSPPSSRHHLQGTSSSLATRTAMQLYSWPKSPRFAH